MLIASAAFAAERHRGVNPPNTSAWTAPACQTVEGLPGFYFSSDQTRTVSANALHDPINVPVLLAITDVANHLLAVLEDGLYESGDAGCHWFFRGKFSNAFTGIVA